MIPMSYEKSLTTSVQAYISSELALKVMQANTTQEIGSTARQIREYLTDSSTISTPDFVIRRYLQTFHPGILADLGPLPDLIRNEKNVPWPAAALSALAGRLEKLSREQNAAISAAEWNRYLGKSVPTSREKVFRMAFTLKMDTRQTLDLLLAYGMEPYSVRYPLDLVCLFCQKVGGTYTWAQAKQMYDAFLERRIPNAGSRPAASVGGTMQLQSDLNELFERSLQGANAQQALIDYMVAQSGEFISFRDRGREIFLPGYSLQRSACFGRLVQYLAVVYPKIIVPAMRRNVGGDPNRMDPKQWHNTTEYVVDKATGKLSLTTLVRAMFHASGWLELEWKEDAPKGSFDDNMRIFCGNYKQHIDKINRLYAGGSNIAFFDRRDALLFIFFLFSGCLKLLGYNDYESEARLEKLRAMGSGSNPFDSAVGQALNRIISLYEDPVDAASHFRILCQCFDMILGQMGYAKLYLPAQFDRFVLLALLSEDPEELASLVMSEAEWEHYDLPFDRRPGTQGKP